METYDIPGHQAQTDRQTAMPGGTILSRSGLTGRMSPEAGSMIAKIFFLAKIIHRIGTRSLRDKKSFPESMADK
jgi:hypothetical protein